MSIVRWGGESVKYLKVLRRLTSVAAESSNRGPTVRYGHSDSPDLSGKTLSEESLGTISEGLGRGGLLSSVRSTDLDIFNVYPRETFF